MLVLSRKLNEKIHLGDNITVTVLRVQGNTIRLGIDAPRDVRVLRGELEPLEQGRGAHDQLFQAVAEENNAEACDQEADKRSPRPRPFAPKTAKRVARPLAGFVSASHPVAAALQQTL